MPAQKKIDTVADLQERLQRASIVVSADFRGLRVREMDDLRRRLKAAGVELKVVKNTLLRRAAEGSGRPQVMEIVEGPTALALSYGDVIAAARVLTEYAQAAPPTFSLRGAFLDGQTVSPADLRDLVRLPSKPVMLARVIGQLQSPLAGLVGLLDAPLQELALLLGSALSELPGVIEARARQLEAAEPSAQAREEQATEEEAAEEQAAEEQAAEEQAAEEQAAEEQAAEEQATEEQATEEEATEEEAAEEQATEDEGG